MGNIAIIEVAIGLIFVFSLMSILVTEINTVIINFLNLKAKRLKENLDKVLTDPVVRAKIYTHPLIGLVENDPDEPITTATPDAPQEVALTIPEDTITSERARNITEGKRAKVAYIEPSTFVDVLVDVLTANTGEKLYQSLNDAVEKLPPSVEKSQFREHLRKIQYTGEGLEQIRGMINALADPETQRSMLQALNLVDSALDKLKVENSSLIPLVLGVKQIKDKYLQAALEAVLNTATDLRDAQIKLAIWFQNMMDRASQRYTREMQRFSLGIGLLLALVLNVDTLHLARTLWEDPALRAAVSVTAQSAAPQIEGQTSTPVPAEAVTEDVLEDSIYAVQATLQRLLDLRLPIGWTLQTPTDEAISVPAAEADGEVTIDPNTLLPERDDARNLAMFWPPNNPDWFGLWLRKIIGIAITTVAVAQGAPFWFDLLRRLARGGRGDGGAG